MDAKQTPELSERVITPHTGLDAFAYAIKSIARDLPQSMALAWRMFLRDTSATYRQSLLGYVWLFLPPMATVFIFVGLNRSGLVDVRASEVPYALFVVTGTVLWTAFNSSVMAMQEIIGGARSMLSKVHFPHEALILTALAKALMNSVIPALLLLPALLIYDINVSLNMLLFPLGFVAIILLGCAIGLFFVPIGALYGDVGRGIQLALRFGFFVTPVIYALPPSGMTRTLLLWNPVTPPLVSSRAWLIGGETPLGMETLLVAVMSLLVLLFATVVFKVVMPHLIERLNS